MIDINYNAESYEQRVRLTWKDVGTQWMKALRFALIVIVAIFLFSIFGTSKTEYTILFAEDNLYIAKSYENEVITFDDSVYKDDYKLAKGDRIEVLRKNYSNSIWKVRLVYSLMEG